jgi:hypothetical protein
MIVTRGSGESKRDSRSVEWEAVSLVLGRARAD